MCRYSIAYGPLPHPPIARIANGFATQPVTDAVQDAIKGGIRWVHLRDHDADAERFRQAATAWAERTWNAHPEVNCTLNTRLEMARTLGGGLHTG